MVSFIDVANRFYDLVTGSPFDNIGITKTCVLYLENIPQLIIGFVILLCRGEEEVLFPVIKAAFFLIISTAAYFLSSADCVTVTSLRACKCNANCCFELFFFIGTLFTMMSSGLVLACCLFFLVYDTGSEYQQFMYFLNVGIYVETSNLQFAFNDSRNSTWMKLLNINDILHDDKQADLTMRISTDIDHVRVQIFYHGSNRNASDICYHRQTANDAYLTKANECSLSDGNAFHYRFKYLPRSKRYAWGDIQYNVEKTSSNSCDKIPLLQAPYLKYFQLQDMYFPNEHLRKTGTSWPYQNVTVFSWSNKFRFFNAENDLIDIRNVWKTDIDATELDFFKPHKCENSGSISPHLSPDISILCRL